MLDIQQIKELIPHRYQLLLDDKVTEMEEGARDVGYTNLSFNDPYFQVHFPDYPVMPSVLILESLAQVGAIAVLGMEQNIGKFGFLSGVYKSRFKFQVVPGDELKLEFEILRMK